MNHVSIQYLILIQTDATWMGNIHFLCTHHCGLCSHNIHRLLFYFLPVICSFCLFLAFVFAMGCSGLMWDLSPETREWTWAAVSAETAKPYPLRPPGNSLSQASELWDLMTMYTLSPFSKFHSSNFSYSINHSSSLYEVFLSTSYFLDYIIYSSRQATCPSLYSPLLWHTIHTNIC